MGGERATGASQILELKVSRLSKKSARRGTQIEGVTGDRTAGAGCSGLLKGGLGRALPEEDSGPPGPVSPQGKARLGWASRVGWSAELGAEAGLPMLVLPMLVLWVGLE